MTKVMVVDDDLDIQLLLRFELTAEGFDVVTADHGGEALELLPVEKPDAVLLDVMMPVVDGWGVLEQMSHEKPVVVMVSAFVSVAGSVLDRALGLGADDFIQKPFEPERVTNLVKELVAMTSQERSARRAARMSPGA